MSNKQARVSILIEAKSLVSKGVDQAVGQFGKLRASLQGIGGLLASLGASLSAAAIGKFLVETNKETQRLAANLETVTGSATRAKAVFDDLRDFAQKTPFQIGELTDAFITLKSAGIDPSLRTLTALGNLASSRGKRITDLASAIFGATTNEFDPLKQFGVVARIEGAAAGKLLVTFKGVTQQIGKDAGSIIEYLQSIGEKDYAGGMERQMATIGGAFSNLGDSAEELARRIGDAGLNELIIGIANDMRGAVDNTGGDMAELRAQFLTFVTFFKQLGKVLEIVAELVFAPIRIAVNGLLLALHTLMAAVAAGGVVVVGLAEGLGWAQKGSTAKMAGFVKDMGKAAGADVVGAAKGVAAPFRSAYELGAMGAEYSDKLSDIPESAATQARLRAARKGRGLLGTTATTPTSETAEQRAQRQAREEKARQKAIDERIDQLKVLAGIESARTDALLELMEIERREAAVMNDGTKSVEERARAAKRVQETSPLTGGFGAGAGPLSTLTTGTFAGNLPTVTTKAKVVVEPIFELFPIDDELTALTKQLRLAVEDAFNGAGLQIDSIIGDTLGALFAGGVGNAADVLLQSLGGVFSEMGKALLSYGLVMEGLLPALANPFTSGPAAIAAGAALLAIGGTLSRLAMHGGRAAGYGAMGSATRDANALAGLPAGGDAVFNFPEGSVFDPTNAAQVRGFVSMIEAISGRRVTLQIGGTPVAWSAP